MVWPWTRPSHLWPGWLQLPPIGYPASGLVLHPVCHAPNHQTDLSEIHTYRMMIILEHKYDHLISCLNPCDGFQFSLEWSPNSWPRYARLAPAHLSSHLYSQYCSQIASLSVPQTQSTLHLHPLYLVPPSAEYTPAGMVNFMYQLDWAKECPDNWLNITSGHICENVSGRNCLWISRMSKDLPHQCRWASSNCGVSE